MNDHRQDNPIIRKETAAVYDPHTDFLENQTERRVGKTDLRALSNLTDEQRQGLADETMAVVSKQLLNDIWNNAWEAVDVLDDGVFDEIPAFSIFWKHLLTLYRDVLEEANQEEGDE